MEILIFFGNLSKNGFELAKICRIQWRLIFSGQKYFFNEITLADNEGGLRAA